MKKTIAAILTSTVLSFSAQANFNYKINNDEFLYKKRIMEEELLNKNFDSIVALKSFLLYNEFTSSNLFFHFKLADSAGITHVQQFILKQNAVGTPTLYEIQPEYLYSLEDNPLVSPTDPYILDTFINNEVGSNLAKKEEYFLPTQFNYDKIDVFLRYAYSHTLKFVLRNELGVIRKKINTQSFYLTFDVNNKPVIATNNTAVGGSSELNQLLFSFAGGFNISKNTDFKGDVRRADLTTETDYINNEKLTHDKSLDIERSPSFINLVKPTDDFSLSFTTKTLNETTGQMEETLNEVKILEFYIVKAEVEFVD